MDNQQADTLLLPKCRYDILRFFLFPGMIADWQSSNQKAAIQLKTAGQRQKRLQIIKGLKPQRHDKAEFLQGVEKLLKTKKRL